MDQTYLALYQAPCGPQSSLHCSHSPIPTHGSFVFSEGWWAQQKNVHKMLVLCHEMLPAEYFKEGIDS